MRHLVRRAVWGARGRLAALTPRHRRFIVHTEAGAPMPATATPAQEQARMRAVDAYHLSLGWGGGFGYCVGYFASGRRYEGRGVRREGAHTVGFNRELGVVVLGHGDREAMTAACIAAMRTDIAECIAAGDLAPDFVVSGHRDHIPPGTKSCPGSKVYPQLPQLRGTAPTTHQPATAKPPEEDDDLKPDEREALLEIRAALGIDRRPDGVLVLRGTDRNHAWHWRNTYSHVQAIRGELIPRLERDVREGGAAAAKAAEAAERAAAGDVAGAERCAVEAQTIVEAMTRRQVETHRVAADALEALDRDE